MIPPWIKLIISKLRDIRVYQNVPGGPVVELGVRTWRSVDKDDREADSEDPDRLENPEDGKPERIRSLVVEPAVLTWELMVSDIYTQTSACQETYFDDPVKQVARETKPPKRDSRRGSDLPPLVGAGQHHRRQRQHHEVCSAGKVSHLVNSEVRNYTRIHHWPAVTLSNLQVQATRKKANCIPTVMITQMARLLESLSKSSILLDVIKKYLCLYMFFCISMISPMCFSSDPTADYKPPPTALLPSMENQLFFSFVTSRLYYTHATPVKILQQARMSQMSFHIVTLQLLWCGDWWMF